MRLCGSNRVIIDYWSLMAATWCSFCLLNQAPRCLLPLIFAAGQCVLYALWRLLWQPDDPWVVGTCNNLSSNQHTPVLQYDDQYVRDMPANRRLRCQHSKTLDTSVTCERCQVVQGFRTQAASVWLSAIARITITYMHCTHQPINPQRF
jgi:hypothetical protein